MVEKTANANWNGTLTEGSGSFSLNSSGILTNSPVTWAARTGEPDGKTSPEELIAAAHASCYAMAFAYSLQSAGTPAESLNVTATVGFGPKPEGGMQVTHSHLTVHGVVPGLTAGQFTEAAIKGEQGCPVSNALRGNVAITVTATLT